MKNLIAYLRKEFKIIKNTNQPREKLEKNHHGEHQNKSDVLAITFFLIKIMNILCVLGGKNRKMLLFDS